MKTLDELLKDMNPEVLGLMRLDNMVEDICEQYRLSVNMHSGDRRWFSLTPSDLDISTPYAVEVFLTDDHEVKVRAVSIPVRGSMVTLTVGDFSYPNPAWKRQFRIFKDMVGTLVDEYEEK